MHWNGREPDYPSARGWSTHALARRIYRRIWPRALRGTASTTALKKAFVRILETALGHQAVYDGAYFDEVIEPAAAASAVAMTDSIARDLAPRRVLDVGCGTGALLAALQARGCEVLGLERAVAALAVCSRRGVPARAFDLERDRLPDGERFDLVLSFEVAEHLPASGADRFVELLSSASNSRVAMSAARPGQGGLDHQNEQEPRYWSDKFAAQGFVADQTLCDRWRTEWIARGVASWYCQNLLVLRRTSGQPRSV